MSRFPIGLQTVYVVITSAAAAGGLNTTTLLAAPGAGKRICVWKLDVHWPQSSAGDLFGYVTSPNDATHRAAAYALSDEKRSDHAVIPGGFACGTNQPLTDESRATGVSQPYRVLVGYTVEAA
jgi:hypothetical protein